MILALDTATNNASIALHDGEKVWAESTWRSLRRHTITLAPQVDALLELSEISPSQLTAVAVAVGPGSFTGTRVAVSYAKGMNAALGVRLLGIPTLDVLAYQHPHGTTPLCALVAAGRARYCWATYAPQQQDPDRTSDWGLGRLAEFLPDLPRPLRFVGELRHEDKITLEQTWTTDAIILPPALSLRRAGVLAELAWLRLQDGQSDDAVTLSPIYLSS